MSLNSKQILNLRRKHIADNVSLSYARPLHMVRGEGQYLYDAQGQRYLDLVNNVAHLGHCHPHVIDAAYDQLKKLNTNTRYLDANLVEYAEKLLKHFPPQLSVVYFVNSGSEANDLALRLARAVRDARHKVHLRMRAEAEAERARERKERGQERRRMQASALGVQMGNMVSEVGRLSHEQIDESPVPRGQGPSVTTAETAGATRNFAPTAAASSNDDLFMLYQELVAAPTSSGGRGLGLDAFEGDDHLGSSGRTEPACDHCQRSNIICLDHAYHGHTQACIEVSPYKFNGRGGGGRKPYIYVARCPDIFRARLELAACPADLANTKIDEGKLAEEFASDIDRLAEEMYHDHQALSKAKIRQLESSGSGDLDALLQPVVRPPEALDGRQEGRIPDPSEESQQDTAPSPKCCKQCCPGCCGRPVAFIAESAPGCAGQIILPRGYLSAAYKRARQLGAVCIADEVQIGFGRVGTAMWGFQTQPDTEGANEFLQLEEIPTDDVPLSVDESDDVPANEAAQLPAYVVPDIVTMGKPTGNGWPLGIVVTTKRIAKAFSNTGMEYFNTFGGNTASVRVGKAVLEVIEREHLQDHAHRVGTYLLESLKRQIVPKHGYVVADVRGLGLYVGIELIRWSPCRPDEPLTHMGGLSHQLSHPQLQDSATQKPTMTWEPAAEETSWVANELVERHRILISTDGPDHNVLKIKPPMCITIEDMDYFVNALDQVLSRLPDEFAWARAFLSQMTPAKENAARLKGSQL